MVDPRRPLLFAAFALPLAWLVARAFGVAGADLGAIGADILKRPYITVGFTAFALLVPLAVTSTNAWMRRLGPRWHRLHRLVYPAAILGVTHFWWQVKADWREPAVYAVLLAVLLAWRARRALRRTASPGVVVASR